MNYPEKLKEFLQNVHEQKDEIDRIWNENFNPEISSYYLYKYHSKSFKAMNVPFAFDSAMYLLESLAPSSRRMEIFRNMVDAAKKPQYDISMNERWLSEPFIVFSTYLHLKTIFDQLKLINTMRFTEPEKETIVNMTYQALFF